MNVHNHGTEEGAGLACRESLVDGQLRGACMTSASLSRETAIQAPCIVCGVVPESAMRGTDWQPYAATEFVTYGHYGSTVFDPMDSGQAIFINVCDACLIERADRVHERETVETVTHEVRPWSRAALTDEGTG